MVKPSVDTYLRWCATHPEARLVALLGLVAFLLWTGSYIFVYLFRAFATPVPAEQVTVFIWHGDPMARAILVAVLFAIGLLVLQFLFIDRALKARTGSVPIRGDLWEWVNQRAEETNEQPDRIVDRALATYRDRMTGTHTDG